MRKHTRCVYCAVALTAFVLAMQSAHAAQQPTQAGDSLPRRHKRQIDPNVLNPFFDLNNFATATPPDPFAQRRRQRQRIRPGAELIFSGANSPTITTTAPSTTTLRNMDIIGPMVYINNRPTASLIPAFVEAVNTPQYRACLDSCPTTSEYNPICANDRNLYHNEQKFNCARRCGADIQILRRGGCEMLFPMMRG